MKIEINTSIPLSSLAHAIVDPIKDKVELEKKRLVLNEKCCKYVGKVWRERLYETLKWATQETNKALYVYAVCKQNLCQWDGVIKQEKNLEEEREAHHREINGNLSFPYYVLGNSS